MKKRKRKKLSRAQKRRKEILIHIARRKMLEESRAMDLEFLHKITYE